MRPLYLGTLCLTLCLPLRAEDIVNLRTRDGVTQSYLLSAPGDGAPHAIAVLFAGGGGNLRLRMEEGAPRVSSNNFLVRSRSEFVQRGTIAAVVDAPSDQQLGMEDEFRAGATHLADMRAVVADLRRRFPGAPVFLVGTSRGTVSAAYVGREIGSAVAGVVLTAAVYLATGPRARYHRPGLSGFDFASLKAPLLLVHHRDDGCNVTPFAAARQLADRYPLISVSGGLPPVSRPCEALSEHGFLGQESKTVEAIVNWMLRKPHRSEID
ncbi:MAG: lysophospholipase [Betaproteobacteria bacterium]|nr:lysophospholipase [Betaproteobacteria bacterium]